MHLHSCIFTKIKTQEPKHDHRSHIFLRRTSQASTYPALSHTAAHSWLPITAHRQSTDLDLHELQQRNGAFGFTSLWLFQKPYY